MLDKPATTCMGNCWSPTFAVAGDVFDGVFLNVFFPTRCLG